VSRGGGRSPSRMRIKNATFVRLNSSSSPKKFTKKPGGKGEKKEKKPEKRQRGRGELHGMK